MTQLRLIAAALLMLLQTACDQSTPGAGDSAEHQAQAQSTLVHNVKGYSVEEGVLHSFSALEFAEGVIVARYKDFKAADHAGKQLVDGEGATMLPGLIDSHGHVSSHGMALENVDLVQVASAELAAERVQAFISTRPDASWVLGRGWNQVLWPGKQFPNKAALDAVSSDKAVALNRIDGHAMWVNSKALELAGITAETKDPSGGQIIRDDKGEATGVLVDNAMDLIFAAIPDVDQAAYEQAIVRALDDLASQGLTSVHDAGINAVEVAAFQSLRRANKMPIRVYAMLHAFDPDNQAMMAGGIIDDEQDILDIRSVKISSDGALGSRGAALLQDYHDQAGHRGLLLYPEDKLRKLMKESMSHGYQVNVHAIGDRANRLTLDLFEELQSSASGSRHRIEHAQILNPSDLERFKALNIVASIQPTHATSDMNMAGTRLGEDRLAAAYAWRQLMESGARLAGGSDFPVERPNLFHGLYSAVTRQDQNGAPVDGWLPAEKLNRTQALALFTEGAAYAAHQEDRLGRLAPGYWADFVLLRDDYFTISDEKLWQNDVLQTWVNGHRIFLK